ncbi:rho guanine nucleotide exchange factor 2 [Elysia marginata]|uniref:Rho guanine nucleotide exchange factor 2 n=1 Tax=Elysia marginata TaxID=1093978 RepID=A0AAV4GFW7_9GAST|nr:rho guanine nucleotide exchange factor 2 [Elysia marginata]
MISSSRMSRFSFRRRRTYNLRDSVLIYLDSIGYRDNSSSSSSPTCGLPDTDANSNINISTSSGYNNNNNSSSVLDISGDTNSDSGMTDTISESMESLDGVVPSEMAWLEDEPDLQLAIEEPEAWSITVDRKTLKKLGTKDIKRQDTIWELINTEKQYVKRLKIMQKIFAQSMLRDMNFTQDQVDRLFPRLDELVALHADFLRQLLARQAKNEDRFVEDIGDILLAQFQDSAAEKMKTLYGVFCSKHTEAMQLYKEFLKVDRKFQNFAKKCTNLSVCEKRDISDFILGVTVRLSKYPILIEAILKSTKDKKDRENMSRALLMSKEVVQHIDEKVAAYEKLLDIISKMDSRAVTFKNKKFKRQDLNMEGRELVHSGKIGWKSARGRIYDVLAVVLTDIIVFLQKNEQKYTFLMQDNKSCVIPLYRLLVREKRDARDSLGIYMICPNHTTPELYEVVCSSKTEREDWIRTLQEAIRACPPDVEPEDQWAWGPGGRSTVPSQSETAAMLFGLEQERRRREEHANQVKLLIEQLHEKDDAIKACCDEKSKLMFELLELSTPRHQSSSRPNSQEIVSANESVDIVQAAMEEASRLTTILQGSGTQLSRSVSSVGEHHSSTFVATPIPKRAETFAGFDSNHDSPKMSAMKQKFSSQGPEGITTGVSHERSSSDLSIDQQPEGDTSLTDMPETAQQPHREESTLNVQHPMSSSQHSNSGSTSGHLWEENSPQQQQQQHQLHQQHLTQHLLGSDRSSDRESLGELSAASVSSLMIPTSPSPSNHEQMTSIFHLVQYLNTLMNLTSKQCTKVESLRAELAEAKSEIAKLSEDMQQQQQQQGSSGSYYSGTGSGVGSGVVGRRSVYKHDQLEELRNLQENISRERQEWERTKLQDRSLLDRDRQALEQERRDLEKEKLDLRNRREELKRQREALQCQMDMMREQGYVLTSPFGDQPRRHHSGDSEGRDMDRQDSALSHPQQQDRPINHRRSASADFYNTVGLSDVENIPTSGMGDSQVHQGRSTARLHPRLSVGSLSAGQQNSAVTGKPPQQPGLPVHLLSARNEQRVGGVNVQRLPLKLSGGSNNSGASMANNATVAPSAAFCAGVQQPFPSRGGVSRVQSMSATSRAALAQHLDNSRSVPSGLSRVMKLADPKGKSSSFAANSSSSSGAAKSSHVSPAGKPPVAGSSSGKPVSAKPQPGGSPGAPGAPMPNTGRDDQEAIIYF